MAAFSTSGVAPLTPTVTDGNPCGKETWLARRGYRSALLSLDPIERLDSIPVV